MQQAADGRADSGAWGPGGAAGGGGGGARERQTWLTNDDGTWDGGDVSGSNVLGKTTEQA